MEKKADDSQECERRKLEHRQAETEDLMQKQAGEVQHSNTQ